MRPGRAEGDAGSVVYGFVATPLGELLVARAPGGLIRLNFTRGTAPVTPGPTWTRDDAAVASEAGQLREYFEGARRVFRLRLAPRGTAFQLRVWQALRRVRHGRTATYGDIARALGRPGGARAVGGAVGANPLPILVPCHRIVAAGGAIGGYTGGLAIKRHLLTLEGLDPDGLDGSGRAARPSLSG